MPAHSPTPAASKLSGFSMVELSIAIVVIAIILGGVLTGQDLIRAAEIRAGIHQLENYQSAVNNFRLRFQSIPGDFKDASTQFIAPSWSSTPILNGDGDGILRDASGVETLPANLPLEVNQHDGELAQFWYQLSASGVIDERFDGGAVLGTSFPQSKIGKGGIGVYGLIDQANYFYIGLQTPVSGSQITTSPALTPEEASAIDKKTDDGHPLEGEITAAGGSDYSGTYAVFNYASLLQTSPPLYTVLLLKKLTVFLISPAFAATTERTACVYTKAGSLANAYYAVGAGGVNCQLRKQIQ